MRIYDDPEYPDFSKNLSKRIREARQKKGWTQEYLGLEAGVCSKFVANIESGKKTCRVYALYKIAKTLDVSMDWLVGMDK